MSGQGTDELAGQHNSGSNNAAPNTFQISADAAFANVGAAGAAAADGRGAIPVQAATGAHGGDADKPSQVTFPPGKY